jgi:predicted phage terminase large subunit-like protein
VASALDRYRASRAPVPTLGATWAAQVDRERDPGPRLSLAEFVRGAWPQIEPGPLEWSWHLDAMCAHAEAITRGEITRLIVNVPPGHMKSLVWAVCWPAWEWTRDPRVRWLVLSVNELAAKRDARRCRTLLASEWYRSRWGHRVRIAGDESATDDIGLTSGGKRWLRPFGGTITALRGDRVVVDDPQGVNETLYSAAYREATREKMRGEVLSRVNDERRSAIVVTQQRVHVQDVTGDLASVGGWERLTIPMEYDADVAQSAPASGWRDPRTERGELIHAERFGPVEVARARLTVRAYEAQYNQRPSADGGGRIKREWLRYSTRAQIPPVWAQVVDSWDLTMGKARRDGARGDREGRRSFVVGQKWGVAGGGYYLLQQVRDELEAAEQLRAIAHLVAAPAPKAPGDVGAPTFASSIYIEDAALGPASSSLLPLPQIVLVPTRSRSKEERLDDVLPLLAGGRVYLPDPAEAPWVTDLVRRLLAFPSSEADDEVDALSQALGQLAHDPAANLEATHRAIAGMRFV